MRAWTFFCSELEPGQQRKNLVSLPDLKGRTWSPFFLHCCTEAHDGWCLSQSSIPCGTGFVTPAKPAPSTIHTCSTICISAVHSSLSFRHRRADTFLIGSSARVSICGGKSKAHRPTFLRNAGAYQCSFPFTESEYALRTPHPPPQSIDLTHLQTHKV